jgi:TonB family protein
MAQSRVFAATLSAMYAIVGRDIADDSEVRILYAPYQLSIPIETLPKPVPTLSTAAPCADKHVDARIRRLVEPVFPKGERGQMRVPVISAQVTLDSNGKVTRTMIYRSSGNPMLDQAVISAAQASTYSPELEDCHPVGGSYLYSASFPK